MGKSYYQYIDGVCCARDLLEAAKEFSRNGENSPISEEESDGFSVKLRASKKKMINSPLRVRLPSTS